MTRKPRPELLDAIAKARAEADQSLAHYRELAREGGPPPSAAEVLRRAGWQPPRRPRRFGRRSFLPSRARFIVTSVTGFPISQNAIRTPAKPATVYQVLDRAYCHRIVAEYPCGGGHTSKQSRRAAESLAVELNARYAP